MRRASINRLGFKSFHIEVGSIESESVGQSGAVSQLVAETRLILCHRYAQWRARLGSDGHGQHALANLLPKPCFRVAQSDIASRSQYPPRPQRIVAGAEHLRRWRERPQ